MPIRSAQTTLDQLYAVRDDLLTGKVASYSIGDRNITLQNITELETIIQHYESVVVASESGPVLADMSGPANSISGLTTTQYIPYP
jgi:hypothetical protein